MRLTPRLTFAALAVAALVGGCGDNPAPTATVQVDPQPRLSLQDGSTYTSSFTVSATAATSFSDGVNTLNFPAASVCDPAISSYGPGEWDNPCTPISKDLTITVTATVTKGRVNLDFSPSVRFVPTKTVTFTVRNDDIKTKGENGNWAVFFRGNDGKLVDEAKNDASLITTLDRTNGVATRRIKHFTGYNVWSGAIEDCTPYVDPYCMPIGDTQATGS